MMAGQKAGSSRLSVLIFSFHSASSSGLLLFAGLVVASLDISLVIIQHSVSVCSGNVLLHFQ